MAIIHTIDVAASRPYTVHVGAGCLEQVGALVRAACGGDRAAIIADSNVGPLYAEPVRDALRAGDQAALQELLAEGDRIKRELDDAAAPGAGTGRAAR